MKSCRFWRLRTRNSVANSQVLLVANFSTGWKLLVASRTILVALATVSVAILSPGIWIWGSNSRGIQIRWDTGLHFSPIDGWTPEPPDWKCEPHTPSRDPGKGRRLTFLNQPLVTEPSLMNARAIKIPNKCRILETFGLGYLASLLSYNLL